MRAPPPLRWHCADVRGWRAFTAVCFALACVSGAAWALAHAEVEAFQQWLGVSCVLLPALIGGWHLMPAKRGTLECTGAAWTWHAEGSVAAVELQEVRLCIDLQSTLLLRLHPAALPGARSRAAWVVLQRAQDPARWPLLCALLQARLPAAPAAPPRG